MNPAAIRSFATRSASARLEAFGVELEFRGEMTRGIVTANDPNTTLEGGGFREEATWRLRLPGSIQPPPRIQEPIKEPGTGRVFFVVGVIPANPSSPLAAEHIIDAAIG